MARGCDKKKYQVGAVMASSTSGVASSAAMGLLYTVPEEDGGMLDLSDEQRGPPSPCCGCQSPPGIWRVLLAMAQVLLDFEHAQRRR